ncbi:MAG: hypothetical protein GWN86_08830 [Desulfobacterales bacterium]|nr:hypothetical protein [Desulfobacterales bacterium]
MIDNFRVPQRLRSAFSVFLKNKMEFSLVLSALLFGFAFYLWIFLRNQLVPMIDGPYYLLQVRSVLTTGGLLYGDPPLTFYLLSFFSILLGDITLGVKVGVSFFCALSTIPAYFLMKRVGNESVFTGIVAMLLVIFSAPYIRMLTDFMKNAIGICWLFSFIYYLHEITFSDSKKSSTILATFFLLLTGLTHILDFGLALVYLALYTGMVLIFNVNRRSFMKALSVMILAVSAFVLVAITLFSPLFTDFGKILSFINNLTAPQSGEDPTSPSIPRFAPRPPPPRPPGDRFPLFAVGGWSTVLLILSFGIILSLYAWKQREKQGLLLLVTATTIGSIVCFPLIPSDYLMRFSLMIVVPAAIILSYGISEIWTHTMGDLKIVALVLTVIVLSISVIQTMSVIKSIHPTISDAGYLDLVNMKDQIPSNSIVAVTDHGIRYWIEYIDQVEVTHGRINDLSPDLWQSYSHVLGLFSKGKIPPIPLKTLFVGNVFILTELQQNNLIES